jgi:hypothetical protein
LSHACFPTCTVTLLLPSLALLQASKVADDFVSCITALEDAARNCWNELDACEGSQPRSGASGLGQASPKDSLVIELLSVITQLEMRDEVLEARLALEESETESQADRAAQLRRLLPPAAEVAALLQRYFELPEQEKEAAARALELAQAAGGRSCANLWCANLTIEGRETEGKPTQRCGQCRSVRYCSRACSVADWRAGHKRVCKALAAARDA